MNENEYCKLLARIREIRNRVKAHGEGRTSGTDVARVIPLDPAQRRPDPATALNLPVIDQRVAYL